MEYSLAASHQATCYTLPGIVLPGYYMSMYNVHPACELRNVKCDWSKALVVPRVFLSHRGGPSTIKVKVTSLLYKFALLGYCRLGCGEYLYSALKFNEGGRWFPRSGNLVVTSRPLRITWTKAYNWPKEIYVDPGLQCDCVVGG